MRLIAIPAGIAIAAWLTVATFAQNAAPPAYSSGLGEIMSLQQMRHLKLWFAGAARNWDLAGYELDELKEGFDDIVKHFPTKDDISLAPLVEAVGAKEIPDLAKAIEARDRGRFVAAFDRLTEACNACHRSTKHAFIVIRRPAASPYANQSFEPVRR